MFSHSVSSVLVRKSSEGDTEQVTFSETTAMATASSMAASAEASATSMSETSIATQESTTKMTITTTTTTTTTALAAAGMPVILKEAPKAAEPTTDVPRVTSEITRSADAVTFDLSEFVCRSLDSLFVCYSDDYQACIKIHFEIKPLSVKAVPTEEILLDICSGYSNYVQLI